jgi:site-specific recombinase XerD
VFLNVRGQPLTRFGIHALLERTVAKAAQTLPSLRDKAISPHTLRHTTAVHLLRAGVDINTIRAWLGHVSLETTNRYAEVDLEMKAKALQICAVIESDPNIDHTPSWRKDEDLMAFLTSL